ncbi:hypothetical protein GCM10023205_46370 [Yinghuangia aomiensis]|uniref:Uncharacterized protein n=1 Tax=Yinghuangia aomiensis TaxID=676205 RepID=A0ABP9HN82_9ACTN
MVRVGEAEKSPRKCQEMGREEVKELRGVALRYPQGELVGVGRGLRGKLRAGRRGTDGVYIRPSGLAHCIEGSGSFRPSSSPTSFARRGEELDVTYRRSTARGGLSRRRGADNQTLGQGGRQGAGPTRAT